MKLDIKTVARAVMMSGLLSMQPASAATDGPTPEVIWENLGHTLDKEREPECLQRFTVKNPGGAFSRLAFCMPRHDIRALNPLDTIIEILPGYYAVGSPRFAAAYRSDSVSVDIAVRGWIRNAFEIPDGMHLVADGKSIATSNRWRSAITRRDQWTPPEWDEDPMIYGDEAFAINDSLRSAWRPAAYMQIPTPKSVKTSGKMTRIPVLRAERTDDVRHRYYHVTITGDTTLVRTNCDATDAILDDIERRMRASADASGMVPEAELEDWADYDYRGLMIDVARNFTGKKEIKEILSLMARYGLNVLHFHLGDDEGWRVEIRDLPELTAVGGRRGYTETDDTDFLKQIYRGDGNPESATTANGYYTEEDYIEILRHAAKLGIDVIPEFDSPGHSRAALRAMEYRYRTTGDDSLRLIHDGDTSRYSTAQFFDDNLMNPALEGPYRLWGKVMDGIISLHRRAGVPLRAIHIGGDEVPSHAWDGSSVANDLMSRLGMDNQRELHAHFVERLAALAAERGIKIAGWQEIALDHTAEYDSKVRPVTAAVNCWTNAGTQGSKMAASGYPVVMSNVDYLYLDQTPTTHPEEPGFTWGGLVDEFRPLHATADRLCPGDSTDRANVVGISGHLFAETVRDAAMIQRYLLPRLLGIAERGHNSQPTLSDKEYFGALTEEMGRWAEEGVGFYLRQPGIRQLDGMIEMNEPYGMGEIRYTLDGTDPTPESKLYDGPFRADSAFDIRARLFLGTSRSVTSIFRGGRTL